MKIVNCSECGGLLYLLEPTDEKKYLEPEFRQLLWDSKMKHKAVHDQRVRGYRQLNYRPTPWPERCRSGESAERELESGGGADSALKCLKSLYDALFEEEVDTGEQVMSFCDYVAKTNLEDAFSAQVAAEIRKRLAAGVIPKLP
jgi:hypothetical protein